jgi:RNA polymerase sigma factor (sigma-70 family)
MAKSDKFDDSEFQCRQKELMLRCNAGDELAFPEVIALFRAEVHRIHLRYTGDWQVAEDLSSITFQKLYKALFVRKVNLEDSFWGYCRSITHTITIDYFRQKPLTTIELCSELANEISGADVREKASLALFSEWLQGELSALSERERRLIVLKYDEESTLTEIATELKLCVRRVQEIHQEVLAKLRRRFNVEFG